MLLIILWYILVYARTIGIVGLEYVATPWNVGNSTRNLETEKQPRVRNLWNQPKYWTQNLPQWKQRPEPSQPSHRSGPTHAQIARQPDSQTAIYAVAVHPTDTSQAKASYGPAIST